MQSGFHSFKKLCKLGMSFGETKSVLEPKRKNNAGSGSATKKIAKDVKPKPGRTPRRVRNGVMNGSTAP